MRWEDERYVRVYTRDTLNWLALSFEAQGVLVLLLRKLDRAGILDLGNHGKRGIIIAIGHGHRWEQLAPAVDELIRDGCLRIEGTRAIIRNFVAVCLMGSASPKRTRTAPRGSSRLRQCHFGIGLRCLSLGLASWPAASFGSPEPSPIWRTSNGTLMIEGRHAFVMVGVLVAVAAAAIGVWLESSRSKMKRALDAKQKQKATPPPTTPPTP